MSITIVQQIKDANTNREKTVLHIKYKAMAADPFRFFRGSCQLFYAELVAKYPFPDSPAVWACGDLHIENFGSYKGSNRLVYFDMNDFDEALLAPAFWELSRLAVSVQLAATESGFLGKGSSVMVTALLNAYRQTLQKGKAVVIEREMARGLIRKNISRVAERKEMELVKKRTEKMDPGKLLLGEKLLVIPKPEKKAILLAFNQWLAGNNHPTRAIDAGFRIAGTGSIGVKRYVALLEQTSNPQKKWLADIKQAIPAAALAYASIEQPVWEHEAARIITVQEMMEQVSPAFLSSFEYNGNWFVVKELQPTADKVNLFQTVKQPEHMEHYLADLGMLTASAQLRSSGRKRAATADDLSMFAADESWIAMLNDWSVEYIERVKQDWAEFKTAWQDGFFND